jgi:transcriptional regulator with XRE-family HTH domain
MLMRYPPEKLRRLRQKAMLSLSQVSEITGIKDLTLRDWEHGRRNPQTRTLNRVLDLYSFRIRDIETRDAILGETNAK